MRIKPRKVLRITAIVVFILVIAAYVAMHVLLASLTEDSTLEAFREKDIRYERTFLEYRDGTINTIRVGDPALPKVLLIHGSPGHWFDWGNIMESRELLDKYCMIAYDRPGFGKTTLPTYKMLSDQAEVAAFVMNHYNGPDSAECFIVVGHSYGGGVAEQVLLDYPNMTVKGVFVAGTLSPEHQKIRWYNHLASYQVVKWLLPREMRNSNIEMKTLPESLEQNSGKQRSISQEVVLIQGTNDVLVPYGTVDYYRSHEPENIKYMIEEGMNHFIPWTHPTLVVDAIMQ